MTETSPTPSPLRILLLTRSLDLGGAQRQLAVLAKGLATRGQAVTVAGFYPGGAIAQELAQAGIAVVSLDKAGRWDLIGFFRRLVALVRRERPDVLYGFLTVANILALATRPAAPGPQIVWGVRSAYMDLARFDWLARLTAGVERRLARFADLVLVNSQAGAKLAAAAGFPRDRLAVVPNGIDCARFGPDRAAGEVLRTEWGILPDQRLIGLAARIDPMKDHLTFLYAAAAAARERPELRFVAVGGGDAADLARLRDRAQALGLGSRLIWAGARTDMAAVYNALDITTLSSYGEGFPNVLAEAMACGIPCAATDVGDVALILGECGELAPPRNAPALAQAWLRLLDRLAGQDGTRIGAACRARIETLFGESAMVETTLMLLRKGGP